MIGFRRDRRVAAFLFVPIMLRRMSLFLALSVNSVRRKIWSLSDNSGHR
jgi:hypothetical protein